MTIAERLERTDLRERATADVREPDADSKEFFEELRNAAAPHRTDIKTWAELLDLDDFVSFGGKA